MAKRIPGEFVPCDVNLANDPAIMRAGPYAELLFRRGNEHAKKNDRDGELYAIELPVISLGIPTPAKHAQALIREGLWASTKDGWKIRSFLKWNMSQDEQQTEREKKQAAAILGNHKRHHQKETSADCPHCPQEVTP